MVLLKVLRKTKQKEKEMRWLMLGLDNAGKTTIVKKFMCEDVYSISPTLGFNINTVQYKTFNLNIWDVGGQKSLRSYWRNYFEETEGVVWVVDAADIPRISDCKQELHSLLKEERLMGASLLVLANKQDLAGALTSEQIYQALDLESMSMSRHWCVKSCSAMTGDGLIDGIDWLVDDIAKRIFILT
eukprot:GHVS01047957.1.p1 GENE.GHVS01047957.1~~GHVS01047957.1.p1  ORF type:complete len:186 (-),score=28.40 GHVS01047957.1:429-986(-)